MGHFRTIPDRMAGEEYHIIGGPLTFSVSRVELTLAPGETGEGSFTVYGPAGYVSEGLVGTSTVRMHCITKEFAGSADEVAYRFDASGLSSGDTVEGYFRIVSNQGEYKLPFLVTVAVKPLESREGPVENLQHFAALAKTNFAEAVRLFYTQGFPSILDPAKPQEAEALSLYRGLSASPGNLRNVEEFLIAAGLKPAVSYTAEVEKVRTVLTGRETGYGEFYFHILKNGWGHTAIHVRTEGDFLHPTVTEISDGDFEGTTFAFHYYVDYYALHGGVNLGRIIFQGPWINITIPVEIVPAVTGTDPAYHDNLEYAQILYRMMSYYEDFRDRKMNGREWLSQTGLLVERMMAVRPDDPVTSLYRIHLDISAGQISDAVYRLSEFDRSWPGGLTPAEECYRRYLGALSEEEHGTLVTLEAAEIVEQELRRDPSNWRLAWLLMYLSPEYRKRPSLSWEMLRDQFGRGCRSPILYIEAWQLIRINPAILTALDDFALQILWYAVKRGTMNEAVMSHVNYLAARERVFRQRLFQILARSYDAGILPADTLNSICSLLLRSSMSGSAYFPYFERGVEAGLTLTRLFEFYMLSIPDDFDGEIPEAILRYFCYQSTLPVQKTALLYRYVHEHRGSLAELYEQYRPQIVSFVETELTRRHTGRNLAFLYEHYLRPENINAHNAAAAAEVCFSSAIHLGQGNVSAVIISYDRAAVTRTFAVNDRELTAPIYGEDYHLFLDTPDGRSAVSTPAIIEPLGSFADLKRAAANFDTGICEFDLYLVSQGESFAVSGLNADRCERLLREKSLERSIRENLQSKLLRYLNDNDCVRELDALLDAVSPEGTSPAERAEILAFLSMRGKSAKALEWLEKYDIQGADPGMLMRLLTRLPLSELPENGKLAELIHEVFSAGKYDERMLAYLAGWFEGLSVELSEIRSAMKGFGMKADGITDRLVSQMLYSGAVLPEEEELLSEFEQGGASTQRVGALLAQISHYYFADDVSFGPVIFDHIAEYSRRGLPLYDVCRMAYLKRMSASAQEMGEKELSVCRLFLEDLIGGHIVFPFYRRFAGLTPELQAYSDETMIQFRGRRGANVLIHYTVDRREESDTQYLVKPMKEMYDGIYVTGFILFFGEQVRYFITDDMDQKNVVESGSFGQDTRILDTGDDRFALINRISTESAMKHYDEALKVMEDYNRKALMVEALFHRKK